MYDSTRHYHREPFDDEPTGNPSVGAGSVDLEDEHRQQFGHKHVA